MDRLRLIAEVQKRPLLWNREYRKHNRGNLLVADLWEEVAASMGPDVSVDDCKSKWQNMRCTYRSQAKRIENIAYKSSWEYFEHLHFLHQTKNDEESITGTDSNTETQSEKHSPNGEDDDNDILMYSEKDFNEIEKLQLVQTKDFSQLTSKKLNYHLQNYSQGQGKIDSTCCSYDRMSDSHNPRKELNSMKSCVLDIKCSNDLLYGGDSDYNFLVSCLAEMKTMKNLQGLQFRAKITDLMLNILSPSMSKYPKRSCDHMQKSKDLIQKEKNFIENGILDTKSLNGSVYAGESDYHFLISCLPQMKMMSKLENLQFRTNTTELLLNILSHSMPANDDAIPSSSQIIKSEISD